MMRQINIHVYHLPQYEKNCCITFKYSHFFIALIQPKKNKHNLQKNNSTVPVHNKTDNKIKCITIEILRKQKQQDCKVLYLNEKNGAIS